MIEKIKGNISKPEILEDLYRQDRKGFKVAFDRIFPEIESTQAARFWKARLEYGSKTDIFRILTLREIGNVVIICLTVAFLIKIPSLFRTGIPEDVFYMRNASLIVFSGLTLYTLLTKRISEPGRIIMTVLAFLLPSIFINLLPAVTDRASINLSYIHLPLLMWFIYGIVFTDYDVRDIGKRIGFIRYNGDLAIIYALIAIAGGLLTAVTISLFESIGLNIGKFYSENIVLTGAAAAPVVAAYLIEKFPALVSKIAPLIAGLFSPLVLITLVVFLITMLVTGKDPYNDRDFLLIFNIMLLGVMGIIIFSVSETSIIKNQKFNVVILFVLSIITIIIDLIALSAIFYRLREYGLSPNRLAVLVSNILVLINLILIMTDLFSINFKRKEFHVVEITVSKFLPFYLVWIIIVTFGFPFIFGMK